MRFCQRDGRVAAHEAGLLGVQDRVLDTLGDPHRPISPRPPGGRAVAELIPGARFEMMEEEAHQPFQEVPDQWNALVDAFWRQLDTPD